MKKILLNTLAITALFALMSNACDDLKEKLKITIPIDLEKPIEISTTEATSIDRIVETEGNEDLNKYLGEIESLTLEKITYQISLGANHTAGSTVSVVLGYSAIDSDTPIEFLNESNILSSTGETEIDLTQAELDAFADLLKEDGRVKLYVNGQTSAAVDFDLLMKFTGSFNALD